MSPGAIRVTASDLGALPLPANEWDVAASALRDSDVTACGRGMLAAYGLPQDGALYEWWERNVLSASKERKG